MSIMWLSVMQQNVIKQLPTSAPFVVLALPGGHFITIDWALFTPMDCLQSVALAIVYHPPPPPPHTHTPCLQCVHLDGVAVG